MRSHKCGEVNETLAGQPVTLCGWVHRRRDLGGLIFISLRDHAGIIQVVIEPDSPAFADAERLRNEYCVRIAGTVRMRPESQWNLSMATGKIELVAEEVELLNDSAPLPLMMTDDDGEEIRFSCVLDNALTIGGGTDTFLQIGNKSGGSIFETKTIFKHTVKH